MSDMFKRAMLEKMQLVGEITELAIATADEVLEQLIQFDQRLILYVSIVFTVTMDGHYYQSWNNKSFSQRTRLPSISASCATVSSRFYSSFSSC